MPSVRIEQRGRDYKGSKKYAKQPIIMKLSPNVTSISEMAKAVEAGGADAVSLINTLTGMKIDVNKKRLFWQTKQAECQDRRFIRLLCAWYMRRQMSSVFP